MNQQNLKKIIQLRHTLHQKPELSLHETNTIHILQDFLHKNTSFEIVDRDGWFYAFKPGASEQSPIAFRTDIDALPIDETIDIPYASINPGISHKCGHDGHMAALCGLALELDQKEIDRPVYLIFQPAEEIGQGGGKCSQLIGEKEITEIYAYHNWSNLPEKTIAYRRGLTQPASEGLMIRLHGKTSHASEPENGRNPSAAIAELALYAGNQTFAPEDGMTMCTIIGMRSGSEDFGIAAGDGSICFTLRAEKESVMKRMEQNLLHLAENLAERDGLQIDYEIRDYFPETVNDNSAIDRVLQAAEALGLSVMELPDMLRGSEDFGYYLKKCPGAIFYIGNGEDYPAIHTRPYDFNDKILESAVDMFAAIYQLSTVKLQ